MITKEQERRLRNWARANRECPRAKKGATLVFCESLRHWYDHEAEEGDDEPPTRPPRLRQPNQRPDQTFLRSKPMKYLPPDSPLRRLIEINALDAETCEQIIREVEQ